MKSTKRRFFTALMLVAVAAAGWAQTSDSAAPSPQKKHKPVAANPAATAITAADVQSLRDALAAQQQQIQQLSQQLQQAQQNWQQAQTAATDAAAKASAAQKQARQEQETVSELKSDLADLKTVSSSLSNNVMSNDGTSGTPVLRNALYSLQEPMPSGNSESTQVYNKQMESPITLRFRGINITPGGYAAGEFVRRSRALSADISTPFNNLTPPGASTTQLSEFFGSGRQSKATVFVDGKLAHVDLSSYISTDFISAGVTSTSTQTDGYTLRVRQAWAQAKFDNGWSFLAGQAWSLVTENGVGISPDDDMGKTNDARPKTIDANYNVGFDFARQWGLRLTKSFNKVAFAFALENPQGTETSHGNANNFLFTQAGASNSYNTTATYTFNPSPDIIAKVAFDPGFGHYEIFGLYDRFKDRVFPCEDIAKTTTCGTSTTAGPNPSDAYNYSKNGGGVGASARWLFAKRLTFGLKGFGGSGVGRYAPGGLSDATINPNGTVRLIKNLHGIGTLELKTKHVDFYSYGGVEYANRTWSIDPVTGNPVGYGAPGFNNTGCYAEPAPGTSTFVSGPVGATTLANCTFDARALIEGTVGFWYRFYSGPKGRFQYGTQYSYVTKNTWAGEGRQPNGIDNMVFTSFRYYLP
jgi:hypothetical protein